MQLHICFAVETSALKSLLVFYTYLKWIFARYLLKINNFKLPIYVYSQQCYITNIKKNISTKSFHKDKNRFLDGNLISSHNDSSFLLRLLCPKGMLKKSCNDNLPYLANNWHNYVKFLLITM